MSNIRVHNGEILVGTFELDDVPADMPLVGLLMTAWRSIAEEVDVEAKTRDNMTERLMDVLDITIAGATTVPESLSGVARTMAYQEQVSGFVNAPAKWRKFIDDIAALIDDDRRRIGAQFVVHIERVPYERKLELERVIRRFAHPRITYR